MRKIIIKIIVSIIFLLGAFFIIKRILSVENAESGEIMVVLIDDSDNIIKEKPVSFTKNDKLIELLEVNFANVKYYESPIFGIYLTQIESLATENGKSYLQIKVNENFSDKGISFIELEDGMRISFIYTYL